MAIVCGFLIVILLCLICFFAHKTRSKIWKYGKPNIYWDKVPVVQEGPNVEEWVSLSVGWGCWWVPGAGVCVCVCVFHRFPPSILPACPISTGLNVPEAALGWDVPRRTQGAALGSRRSSWHWGCAEPGQGFVPGASFCPACAAPVPGPGVFAHRSRQLLGVRRYRHWCDAVPGACRVPPCHPV